MFGIQTTLIEFLFYLKHKSCIVCNNINLLPQTIATHTLTQYSSCHWGNPPCIGVKAPAVLMKTIRQCDAHCKNEICFFCLLFCHILIALSRQREACWGHLVLPD